VRKRTIAVLSTSRADYSHLFWVLHELRTRPSIDLRLIVMGAHLSPEFGSTAVEIERDGFPIAERIECLQSSDTDVGMAKSIGVAVLGLAEVLGRMRPDLLLLIADRYELLAPAAVALALRIPIAHIEGGEISEGAIDDAVRNAVSKMSHLHLTTTEAACVRLRGMSEEGWRIQRVGAASLDHLRRSRLLAREELEVELGVPVPPQTVVVVHHPLTLARDTLCEIDELFLALARVERPIMFCFPNADAGSRLLIDRARTFCRLRRDAVLFVNLPPAVYWSLLRASDLLLGNSSSGIMETASLALPTVNVGMRQQGRLRPRNVLDAPAECAAILQSVEHALSPDFRRGLVGLTNPYGDGHAAERIAEALETVCLGQPLLHKVADEARNKMHADIGASQQGGDCA